MKNIPLQSVSAAKAIEEVAKKNGKSAGEIRAQMQDAIREGFHNPDPHIRSLWAQIPCKNSIPTPEELIRWVSRQITSAP